MFSTMGTLFADVGAESGGESVMAGIDVSAFEGNMPEATVSDGVRGPDGSSPVLEGLLL